MKQIADYPAGRSQVISEFRLMGKIYDESKRAMPPIKWGSLAAFIETRRAWIALDWLIRVNTTAWLRLAGFDNEANLLADLEPVDMNTCQKILPVLEKVLADMHSVWDSFSEGDKGQTCFDLVVWNFKKEAAKNASWKINIPSAADAIGNFDLVPATNGARNSVWDTATFVGRHAAKMAAYKGIRNMAWDVSWDTDTDTAWTVCVEAAVAALTPTALELQRSKHDPVARMSGVTDY